VINLKMLSDDDRLAEIKRLYFQTTRETIRQDFQNPVAGNILAAFCVAFQDSENDVLLARATEIFEAGLGANLQQFVDGFRFQVGKIHEVGVVGVAARAGVAGMAGMVGTNWYKSGANRAGRILPGA